MKAYYDTQIKPLSIKLNNTLKGRKQIFVHYYPSETELEVTHVCTDMPISERCIDCIADYYDGLAQMQEDSYRDEV
jgi:hypothetical protein